MKSELRINIVLGVISLGIIGLILRRAAPPPLINQSTISINNFARHNTDKDCWIRINGKAYNVTSFLSLHPGGPEKILPFCGGPDATTAFATKDGRGMHSPRAEQLLNDLLVGTLSSQ